MKAPKNFEALFLVAAVLSNVAVYATASAPAAHVAHAAPVIAPTAKPVVAENVAVVVVKAKRLTAAEKAAMI